jgi:hypothetical protein
VKELFVLNLTYSTLRERVKERGNSERKRERERDREREREREREQTKASPFSPVWSI